MTSSFERDYLRPRLGRMDQLASIRRAVLDDGKGRGMRVVDVDNGSGLCFSVCPDRGMDIIRASFRGAPLAWLSRNGDVSSHAYDPTAFEWLRTWAGGLLTGCGLSNVGGPCGAEAERHGLHGRMSHIPAEAVQTCAAWNDEHRYSLSVEGQVRESRVFGENLLLTRRISTALGENAIVVRDTIENQGFAPAPMMILYHINLGWPLVDEGARLEAPPHPVAPRDAIAEKGLADWNVLSAPIAGYREQVFFHDLPADTEGLATLRLVNPNLGLALSLSHRKAELPHLVQWKMMGQGEYVLGLEPSNCMPEGRDAAAARGALRQLSPGESVETWMRLAIAPLA